MIFSVICSLAFATVAKDDELQLSEISLCLDEDAVESIESDIDIMIPLSEFIVESVDEPVVDEPVNLHDIEYEIQQLIIANEIAYKERMKAQEEYEKLQRSRPIYEVYKFGCSVDVCAEWQWMIRDYATQYGIDEKWIYGVILEESTFHPNCVTGGTHGWLQLTNYWKSNTATRNGVARIWDDYTPDRNLYNPEDNLITGIEIWLYAIEAYNIDLSTWAGYSRLCYWHNSGHVPSNTEYTRNYEYEVQHFMDELVEIDYGDSIYDTIMYELY